jgi:poly(beta-D-mannuronate) lyase
MRLVFFFLFFISPIHSSYGLSVNTVQDINGRIAAAKPGDSIVIPDGEYRDIRIIANVSGKANAIITIKPQSPGKVIITGQSQIRITGKFVEVRGILFKEVQSDQEAVLFTGATDCILSDCAFIRCGNPKSTFSKIVFIQNASKRNTISRCFFTESISMSISIKASNTNEGTGNTDNTISRNYFSNITRLSDNGQEPVQLGQDQATFGDMSLRTIVEYNLFEHTDGDSEIISNKSSDNVIRYNTFRDCKAELMLRGGSRVRVEGNFIFNCYTGINIHGDNHTIINNYIENCGNGIRLDASQYTTGTFVNRKESGTYQTASSCLIANNTIVNCKANGLYFSHFIGTVHEGNLKDKKPYSNSFINNIIYNPKASAIKDSGSIDFIYKNNIIWPADKLSASVDSTGFIILDPLLVQSSSILRPAQNSPAVKSGLKIEGLLIDFENDKRSEKPDIGCDEKGKNAFLNHPLSPSEVGPGWMTY